MFGAALTGIKTLWSGFMGFLKGLPDKIGGALGGMWNGIKSGFRSVLNGVIDLWNSMPSFKIPSVSIPGLGSIGGASIGLPHIHRLARGGIFASAGLAIVGDRGPELLTMPAGARIDPLAPGGGIGNGDGVI